MRNTARLMAFTCAVALTAGACAGSSKGVSKDDFVQDALAVCAKIDAEIEAISHRVGADPTLDEVKDAYTDNFVPTLEEEVKQLRALTPPEEDRATIDEMLDNLERGIDQGAVAIQKATSLKALETAPTPPALLAASKQAKDYGLAKCAGENAAS
jgi:hypothetical protein